MTEIAIAGGGPAGAYCAYSLARSGFKPVIFDHSHPREKPCGGGLSPFAQEAFPFLKELPFIHAEVDHVQIMYMSGRNITIAVKRKFIITSRRLLDEYILNMAVSNGARLEREKVLEAEKGLEGWKIRTNKGVHKAGILIGADGVRSLVRKVTVGSFQNTDLGMCYGYLTEPLKEQIIFLRFLPRRMGYIWIFPRGDHFCIGIAANLSKSSGLKTELDEFLKTRYTSLKLRSQWAALIPIVSCQTLQKRTAESDWMLIGDAAGHVDPITGEGISFALLSAKLASEAISQDRPSLYDCLWREQYGRLLSHSARLRNLIFKRFICTPYFIFNILVSGQLVG